MPDEKSNRIAQSLFGYQAALKQSGSSLEEYIRENYMEKWLGDGIHHALAIRTTFVNAMAEHLASEGLTNIERVMMSIITDPLAHDVEHTPSISYKGQPYVTTHSMIYCKFLSCFNPKVKGVYVDSPNIRLEIEHPNMKQRGKYLIDFSQMDIEVKRGRGITIDEYYDQPERVTAILQEDQEAALSFFERMLVAAMTAVANKNEEDLAALGVAIEVPRSPFPRFRADALKAQYGDREYESKAGERTDSQIFWIQGLLRENYDLVYPYLKRDGSRVKPEAISSETIFNYDICAKSLLRSSRKQTPALEVLSGGIREWLYDPIVARLVDNRIIPEPPRIRNGNVENIDRIGGYAPFLLAAGMKDASGANLFPDTFGGGIGIERALYALLRGPVIEKVDDITFFGKNPDSHQIYLF